MTELSQAPANAVERGSFAGNASEYFGIWIVNVLLTIVTFGIYSAWAKVRRNRYFYGNTVLMGHSFDYHARGLQIFIGRLIVFGLLIVIQIMSVISPILGLFGPILILILLPWLVARSLRFNMRVTSYRNVRFDFVGGAGGAFVAIILSGIVSVLSLGLLAPFSTRWLYRYVINNIRYGGRPLETRVSIKSLYGAWLVPALIVVIGFLIFGVVAAALGPGFQAWINGRDSNSQEMQGVFFLVGFAFIVPILIIYVLAGVVFRVAVINAVLSSSLFDGKHPLISDMGRRRYVWILISNTLVTMLTFGLMRPWAAVRERRYMVGHMGILIVGEIGEVISDIKATGSPISAEYMDMEGFDFGF